MRKKLLLILLLLGIFILPGCKPTPQSNPVLDAEEHTGKIKAFVSILPQAYFAALAFRWRGARSAKAIARSAYVGQVGKFLLSLAGFAAVFVALRPIDAPAVFAGYLLMLVIQITGSWLLLRR